MEIKILKTKLVDWKNVEILQSDKFKNFTKEQFEKLKRSLVNNGFVAPMYVWENEEKIYSLDGYHRIKAMKELEAEGIEIPKKLPANFIQCIDMKEAKKYVLLYNSHYAKIDKDELFNFIPELNLEELKLEIEIPELEIPEFNSVSCEIKKKDTIHKSKTINEILVPEKERDMDLFDWIRSFEKILVMFSGGKDSMATVATLLENGIPKEKMHLVFNATPLDYDDLTKFVKNFSKKIGIPVDVIGKEMTEEEKYDMFNRNGFPLPFMSWCTSTWKIHPMNRYFKEKEYIGKDNIILVQGWRREESEQRAKCLDRAIHSKHNIRMARPIMDMKEFEVYEIIKKMGWKLHKCYDYYDRLGCIYCFARTRNEWIEMRNHDMETWKRCLKYISEGSYSKNINGDIFRDTILKMHGMKTFKAFTGNTKDEEHIGCHCQNE